MIDMEKVIKGLQNLRDDIATDFIHESDQAVGTIDDAITLLKEQETVEKNNECHDDKTAVECLNAIQTINKYIDEEEEECGCTYWKDKKGYAFHADTGYFFEGLDNFEAYLIKRLRKAVNEK